MLGEIKPDVMAEYLKQIPVGRLGKPDDIANAVLFLASEESGTSPAGAAGHRRCVCEPGRWPRPARPGKLTGPRSPFGTTPMMRFALRCLLLAGLFGLGALSVLAQPGAKDTVTVRGGKAALQGRSR